MLSYNTKNINSLDLTAGLEHGPMPSACSLIDNLFRERKMAVSRLKLARIEQDKTQVDLWMETGIPQWRISLLERGITPRQEEAVKLASALGRNVDELFPAQEDPPNGFAPRMAQA